MFLPTSKLRIAASAGNTIYGQPKSGRWTTEPCIIVRLRRLNAKTSVRADTSASRGNAEETEIDAIFLLANNTTAQVNDIVELRGVQLRITGMIQRLDIFGAHDHTEITATYWRGAK